MTVGSERPPLTDEQKEAMEAAFKEVAPIMRAERFEAGFRAGLAFAQRAGEGERPTYADSPMRAEAEGLYDRSRTTEGNRAHRAGEPPTPDEVERLREAADFLHRTAGDAFRRWKRGLPLEYGPMSELNDALAHVRDALAALDAARQPKGESE